MVGKTISHYRILDKIGEGGMGVVYRAVDTKLQRTVALKFPPVGELDTEEQRARFVREAQAAAALNHPNICTVHDIDEVGGATLIAMEFVEGESVLEKARTRPLPVGEALDIAIQAAQGLQAAHEKGIVHRDVKSANLMVTREGQVKILDFGLAQVREATHLTRSGTTLGTPSYMSPEQAQARPVDRRTDIWSLGVVLYEMLTGQLPFKGEVPAAVAYSVVNEEHDPPTSLRSGLPIKLDRIVDKALTKDPADRYQYIEEMAVDLRALRRQLETGVAEAAPREPRRRRRKAKLSRRTVVAAMVGAAAILAVIAGVYTFTGDSPIESIAVLPLVNEGGDPGAEYLSDGISESLITSLSRLPGLRVKSRDAAFRYKGRETDVQQIGRELGVQAILTGRLDPRGESLSVSAELVSTSDGTVLWRNQYSTSVADVLSVDQEISREIAEQLQLRLTGEQQLRVLSTHDPEAYRLYLQGRYQWQKRGEGLAASRELFQKAVEQDPSYALAWAGLADAFLMLGGWAMMPPGDAYPRARAAARRAVEIEETLAEPHATLGYLKTLYEWDWPGAEREFKRAIELNPEYGTAHHWYALYLLTIGQTEQALASMRRAWEMDPFSPVINAEVAYFFLFARQYDQAVREARKALEMDPTYAWTYVVLAEANALQGKESEAKAAVEPLLRLSKRAANPLSYTAAVLAFLGQTEEAKQLLQELLERGEKQYIFPAYLAVVYASLGEKDQAFHYYDRAVEERSMIASWLRDPLLDGVRSDPRFPKLFERMGLPP